MSEKIYSSAEPEKIVYMALPDGKADVWLHTNITKTKDSDGNVSWEADEVYFRTSMTADEVADSFDALFDNGGPDEDDTIVNTYDLETVRALKLTEISEACNAVIVAGVDVETSNGTDHFNLSTEDQLNISNLFNLIILGGTEFPYQSDGGKCAVYTAQDITAIYIAAQTLITSQTAYHNLLKQYVEALTTIADINAVTYGQELTGDYLTQYTEKMTIASNQMQQILASMAGDTGESE